METGRIRYGKRNGSREYEARQLELEGIWVSDKDNILKELTFLLAAAISFKYYFAMGRWLRRELRYSTGTLYLLNQ